MNNRQYVEYVGNVHIHSRYSDGGEGVAGIARAASENGLDFIGLNDHDYMTDSLHLEEEGFHGKVLVLMGLEIGERYHHYLAFNIREMIRGKGLSPQEVINRVKANGGFGFLAHPFEKGMPFKDHSTAYTWNDLEVEGYAGICIWNYMSRWKERVRSPIHGLYCLLFKRLSLKGPSRKTLAFWDRKCLEKKVVAIGGSDAHGDLFEWGALRFRPFSYHTLLNTINVHLLLEEPLPDDFARAKEQLFQAMRRGRLFIAHDGLESARGFSFSYETISGDTWQMGEEEGFEPGNMVVRSPAPGRIRLVRNGMTLGEWKGRNIRVAIKKDGVYRVEVEKFEPVFGWRPWIFSNPIYLR
ncbi:MAG: CehA/McbA family metallohydrolase [Deltaproteobacteria bacterium]|nr:CehA/McbA family metallohydrolase [Deltaproteobacteria bacterium]